MSTSSLPSFIKIHQAILEKKSKMWKFTDDAMTIAHSSLRLRWAKNQHFFPNAVRSLLYIRFVTVAFQLWRSSPLEKGPHWPIMALPWIHHCADLAQQSIQMCGSHEHSQGEVNWSFNVTINDISVIYVTAHRCAGGLKKKLNLRSGSQRHRHFAGFFNVPVLAPTRDQPFYTVIPTHRPI